jgi:hypothetical protein
MSLPTGQEKTYLDITPAEGGFMIQAEHEHSAELRALFQQHGILCEFEPQTTIGKDALVFTWAVPVSEVREILDAYKNPKGS